MRLRFGTRTSSKKICAVSDERIPILSSLRATLTPLLFMGTQISDLFRCTCPSPVLANRHIQSACSAGRLDMPVGQHWRRAGASEQVTDLRAHEEQGRQCRA